MDTDESRCNSASIRLSVASISPIMGKYPNIFESKRKNGINSRRLASMVCPLRTEANMREQVARLFLDHPASVDETYFEHM
ncbi:MAG: hypothetical protein KDK75_23800, partial [Alphaproteobacteria bacterium]|nr:hypothetical protein [Alphaproteobacteria bacterium]